MSSPWHDNNGPRYKSSEMQYSREDDSYLDEKSRNCSDDDDMRDDRRYRERGYYRRYYRNMMIGLIIIIISAIIIYYIMTEEGSTTSDTVSPMSSLGRTNSSGKGSTKYSSSMFDF
jgi:hypothetical protein